MFYITGIAGFIGSNLANKMASIGMDVSGCDNLKFGVKDNTFVLFDVKDFDQVKLEKDDVLIHCACDNIIYGIEYPVETFKTNALKSIELFRRFNGRIVYLSNHLSTGKPLLSLLLKAILIMCITPMTSLNLLPSCSLSKEGTTPR